MAFVSSGAKRRAIDRPQLPIRNILLKLNSYYHVYVFLASIRAAISFYPGHVTFVLEFISV